MKLSHVKALLPTLNKVVFKLENGLSVPEHCHVTELGMITKRFIDCGGSIRNEKKVNFQLWSSNDFDHRLKPLKLIQIIELSEKQLGIEDAEIEVEYQGETIGKYSLAFDGTNFILQSTNTACLAIEKCILPEEKQKLKLSELTKSQTSCCTPGSDCC